MTKLAVPAPISAGLLLSYKCTSHCRHCLYACSPKWEADWLSPHDAQLILTCLAASLRGGQGRLGVNEGLHFTGGEPFLNFDLLLDVTVVAHCLGIHSTFVETNCYWCTDDDSTRDKLAQLKEAGLEGILISANPFVVEYVPFERIERAVRVSTEIFPANTMVYERIFYDQFGQMGLKGTMTLEEYLRRAGYGLQYAELLAGGRVSYSLGHLFRKYPAERFFSASCRQELIRNWHIHIDNYGNYMPGYCAGLSLGDARDLNALRREGIELETLPVLRALLGSVEALYGLGQEYGYRETNGYVSKCHLCIDIRRHLANSGTFRELQPLAFYQHLED